MYIQTDTDIVKCVLLGWDEGGGGGGGGGVAITGMLAGANICVSKAGIDLSWAKTGKDCDNT